MIQLFMSVGMVVILLTALMLVYVLLMEIQGIDVLSVLRGDKLIIIERIQYIPKSQNVVDVSLVSASMDISHYLSSKASEWGIDTTLSNDTTWVRHETAHYMAYSKK